MAGSDVRSKTIYTQRRTISLYRNSPVRFHAIGSVDKLHLTTPGVEKKNDHVIAKVPIPINEPSADNIGINAPAASSRRAGPGPLPPKTPLHRFSMGRMQVSCDQIETASQA